MTSSAYNFPCPFTLLHLLPTLSPRGTFLGKQWQSKIAFRWKMEMMENMKNEIFTHWLFKGKCSKLFFLLIPKLSMDKLVSDV